MGDQTPPQPAVRITLDQIWAQGVQTAQQLAALTQTVKELADQRTEIDDHETRIRSVELAIAALGKPAPRGQIVAWVVTAGVALMSLIVTLADKL